VQQAFNELESEQRPARSAEDAFCRFLDLMDAVLPVMDKFPRPRAADKGEPEELGLYRQWRELEARRHRHA
jgi:hypothetical protein